MKTRILLKTFCVAAAFLGMASVGFAQKTNAPAARSDAKPAEEKPAIKSVFEAPARPPYTDPFYPLSQRMPYRKQPEKVGPVTDRVVGIDQIVLKGISGPVGRRLALINNYTFAAGESGAIRVPKGTVRIEVLEVRERSAVIKLENDPEKKEIFLRPEP